MNVFETQKDLQAYLKGARQTKKRIALVPTMGALHEGHLSLIQGAMEIADIVICSIFVNPTQFNDPKDLEKYPRPIENDLALLRQANCTVAFIPSVQEMYPPHDPTWHIDLGDLDTLWEGEKRPGHFQGVTQVVYKLFTLVQPDVACFGQKDFQQIMVIQRMIQLENLSVDIHICPTVRTAQGLARSSRNTRLSDVGLAKALALSRALHYIKGHIATQPVAVLKEKALKILDRERDVTVEYIAICETTTLHEVGELATGKNYVALLAAWIEGVRLIDNVLLSV